MKTALALVSLIVLSSLSIYAQEDAAPDQLLASVGFYDADPPATSDQPLFPAVKSADWLMEPLATTTLFPADWATNAADTPQDSYLEDTILRLPVSSDGNMNQDAPAPANLPDFSTLYPVTEYKYFLEDGGLRLRLF